MVPWLWVPLIQRWEERNWKRAISGWARTASSVAKRASTLTPLRDRGRSVTDMVVPFGRDGWSGGRSRHSGRSRKGRQEAGFTLQGFGELDLQLDEAVRMRERR